MRFLTKKNLVATLLVFGTIVIGALFFYSSSNKKKLSKREQFEEILNNHPFNRRMTVEEWKGMPKADRPDLAWEQDFLETMDPATLKPEPERLKAVIERVENFQNTVLPAQPGSTHLPWEERGPNNVGGRTRALMWDPNAASGKKVWAASASGGLWYNNDITDANSTWTAVDNFWGALSISSITYDPNNTQTFYVGTGEATGGTSLCRGGGIYKSTDGGASWNVLPSTSSFYFINDIVVRNEGGTSVVYAGTKSTSHAGTFFGNNGLYRSTDGGSTFTNVSPTVTSIEGSGSDKFAVMDLVIGADNRLWVGTMNNSYGSGGGSILYSDNGTTFTRVYKKASAGRVNLACAPNDANYVYALIEKSSLLEEIVMSTDKGLSFTNVSEPADVDTGIDDTDFSRGQAWYDLSIAVDPNDENTVIVGGVDLFKSTNGGTSWTHISKWSNNNNLSGLPVSTVHADQHVILYKPGSSNECIFGNDGGVFYTSSMSTATTAAVIPSRNKSYNVTQYYSCAIHPTAGTNYYLAGAQDNGTQKFSTAGVNSTTNASGGDGAYCFIDQTNPTYQISSYVYNFYYRSTNGGTSFSSISSDQASGSFINPADYDDNQHILYSHKSTGVVNRIKGINATVAIDNFTVTGLTSTATHFRVSPYTTSSTTLYVGSSSGKLFEIGDAGGSPITTEITGPSFPTSTISCVEIGASESELLVTFKNYGVNSVWYTSDGGVSWVSKEGDLPDMPIRWALFNPTNRKQVILATEVGIWFTNDISVVSPTWIPSYSGLAKVRVDMLQIRASDNQVIAATHGRGLFSCDAFNINKPVITSFTPANGVVGTTVTLTGYNFTGVTSIAFNGTNASSFTVNNDGSITVTVPVGATTGKITAVNGFGTGTSTTDFTVDVPTSMQLLGKTSISVYPTKAQNQITINANNNIEDLQIEVFNTVGQKMMTSEYLRNGLSNTTVNIEALDAGNYLVKVSSSSSSKTWKISKE